MTLLSGSLVRLIWFGRANLMQAEKKCNSASLSVTASRFFLTTGAPISKRKQSRRITGRSFYIRITPN